ncbi:hypothetical protein DFR31_0326 [Alkalispirillum mobile]|uniref:Uncharacterized protein n=1 Tax=Alkalispirillum mobile TaxID=85925 RepID=A0A498CBE9_9GAMM|nr:hypothetical protein [Alkalispirillum mobile]RLK50430.1 hypothetical protein DFR31_0326 [Alkalispirillum mobile]
MSDKNEYVEKMKARLDEWNADISKLQAKARQAEADAKIRYEEQLRELRKQRDHAEEKLKEVQASSEEAWREMRAGMEKAWDDVSEAFRNAMNRFR